MGNKNHKSKEEKILPEVLKVILLGPPQSGKSTLINTYNNVKIIKYIPSIGRDFIVLNKKFDLHDIKFHIHDTAGNEGQYILKMCYPLKYNAFIITINSWNTKYREYIEGYYSVILKYDPDPLVYILINSIEESNPQILYFCQNFNKNIKVFESIGRHDELQKTFELILRDIYYENIQ